VAARSWRGLLLCLALCLLLAACAGAETGQPPATAAWTTRPLPTATPPTTVVVVTSGGRADGTEFYRQLATRGQTQARVGIPTAAPTATRVPPTPTPPAAPTATPRGALFPALVPPDLAGRSDARWLPVPYRSQLDGNPYELADCGPASMAMVLAAYGKAVPTLEVRTLVGKLQGTEGMYDTGTLIENIQVIMQSYGLKPSGLFKDAGQKGFRRWTLDEVRQSLDAGSPLIPQVWYRGLPGRENKAYDGDHYIVLIGYVGDEFIYNDPIERGTAGYARRMTSAQLDKAWRNSDFPYAGVAIAGPADRPSLLLKP
jgi:hypothetical protein